MAFADPVNRWTRQELTQQIRVGELLIGGPEFVVIAGLTAAAAPEEVFECASKAKLFGARLLRGRMSSEDGLRKLRAAADAIGLPLVVEVEDVAFFRQAEEISDMLQCKIGNVMYARASETGRSRKPILLSRGGHALAELLGAAARIDPQVPLALAESGSAWRNVSLDIGILPRLRENTNHPVLVDVSRAASSVAHVTALACAALAAGADGVIIEVGLPSNSPRRSLTPRQLAELMPVLWQMAPAVGRVLPAYSGRVSDDWKE